jgi:Cyclophilin type peptidyl-prolyl cis-trans isomerase/CLD
MGDDDDDIVRYRNENVYKEHLSTSSVFSFHRVLLPLFYALAMLNCGSSLRTKSELKALASSILFQVEFHRSNHAETLLLLDDATKKEQEVKKTLKELQATNSKLKHETRIREEIDEKEDGSHQNSAVFQYLAQKHKATRDSWIDQRHTALMEKIEILQNHIRQQSRQLVLAKYGPGPHRVEFQVQLPSKNTISKFVVELAPLDLMPHSIEIFLGMVSAGAWDNTVFYHHVTHAHVLAAAPVKFGTFEKKDHHLKALGYTGLSFPEYSNNWPHEEYTLGFSGTGPNFYVNAMDNTDHHGPGGQNHHHLDGDADPCFGKIVWGKKVIQDMMPMKGAPGSDEDEEPQSWKDFDVTHIVKVTLQDRRKQQV